MKVTDPSGCVYELINLDGGKVRLQNQRYEDISHDFKKGFIDSAIRNGLLIPLDGKQLKMEMGQ